MTQDYPRITRAASSGSFKQKYIIAVIQVVIYAYAPIGGIRGTLVQVEIDICGNFPMLEIIGLPSSEVREARDRVKIAIKNSGFYWPKKRILINLAPADVRKQGSGFDLSLALAILIVTKQIPHFAHPVMAVGELQLSGKLRPAKMMLPALLAGFNEGVDCFVLHPENRKECSIARHGRYCTVEHLQQLRYECRWVRQHKKIEDEIEELPRLYTTETSPSLADLSHCGYLKRAVQIAAAGRHNLLLSGAPGTGKTASALRIPSLLPRLSFKDSLELSSLYSQSGMLLGQKGAALIRERPIRIPHHSATVEGMIGSSSSNTLGEISLAHRGVLLLDEAPEFRSKVLQSLREPLDQHQVLISRAGQKWICPADFQLLLTSNLCPCGNQGKPRQLGEWCLCTEQEIFRYWKKIGAALWDRIDIKITTQHRELGRDENASQRLHDMMQRKLAVYRAAEIQQQRYAKLPWDQRWNARCPSEKLTSLLSLSKDAEQRLVSALALLGSSERRKATLYRVSQTAADLSADSRICTAHVDEAVSLVRFTPNIPFSL